MGTLYKVALLDTTIANAMETKIETETLAGCAAIERFQVASETELPERVFTESDAIIIWHQVKLSAASIQKLQKCRIIMRNGVGFDNVDIKAAGERGIPVCNVTDYGVEEVADHTLAFALALLRNLLSYHTQTAAGGWDWKIGETVLRRFRDRTFGIIGLGRIGTAVALRAKAFNFKVLFHDPYLSAGVEKAVGIARADTLDELLRQSEIISLHCPLTDETRGMIGPAQFALMRPGVFIINTARGGIVDQAELKTALKSGKVAGAAMDVSAPEPPVDAELLAMPNMLFTPHAAFYSQESFVECRRNSARVVRQYFETGKIWNLVNPEYLK
jgi:phosphoglycerate dehydrogenase-like enzyme